MAELPLTIETLSEFLTTKAVLARLGGMKAIHIRVRSNLGFYARIATWYLEASVIRLKYREREVTLEQLCARIARSKTSKVEVRDASRPAWGSRPL